MSFYFSISINLLSVDHMQGTNEMEEHLRILITCLIFFSPSKSHRVKFCGFVAETAYNQPVKGHS